MRTDASNVWDPKVGQNASGVQIAITLYVSSTGPAPWVYLLSASPTYPAGRPSSPASPFSENP